MEMHLQSKVANAVFSSFAQGNERFLAGKTTLARIEPAAHARRHAVSLWPMPGFCFNCSSFPL
jgi:hypothetical protein